MMSIFSSDSARPNCVTRSPPIAFGVDAEDAVLVAVERHWLAVRLQVGPRGAEVIERGFRGDEPQLHQSAGRVVDERQQRAHLAAILEPAVFGTVDLHQFAQTFTPSSRLMRGGQSCRRSTHSPSAIIHCRSVSTPIADRDVQPVSPPPAWDRNRGNVRGPGSARFAETSRHAGGCSAGHVCAKPTPPGHPDRKHGAGGRSDAAPAPSSVAAASTVSRSSARSIITRSRVSSRSLIWITAIARHPERLDDSMPQ